MDCKIARIGGDGIGPEVIAAATDVLDAVGKLSGHRFIYKDITVGGCSIDLIGKPLPDSAIDDCLSCGAVLLGAVGGPKWENLPSEILPEKALLALRSDLKLYANIRPAVLHPPLKDACPLRCDIADRGIDLVIVRELTGGLYFGAKGRRAGGDEAYDMMVYSRTEIERIGRRAFDLARIRRGKLVSVDKANVLETSRLWREVMHSLAEQYPDIDYSDMLVDNAAMQLVARPGEFDVIVTENTFGDILSDEAGMITGSIGMLPSASLGSGTFGMYEPVHGSAPDIAGQGTANPVAAILSAAMMLELSFGLSKEAEAIRNAVGRTLEAGCFTRDIYSGKGRLLSTNEFTGVVISELR